MTPADIAAKLALIRTLASRAEIEGWHMQRMHDGRAAFDGEMAALAQREREVRT